MAGTVNIPHFPIVPPPQHHNMRPISNQMRSNIIHHAREGVSVRNIANEFGIGIATVSQTINSASIDHCQNHSGCPQKLSVRQERKMLHWISSGSCTTAVQVAACFQEEDNLVISPLSIRRALFRNGLCA